MAKSFRVILTKRVFNAVVTILLIMALNFALFRLLPGDPAVLMMNRSIHESDYAYWRNVEIMGLNDTYAEQFVKYYIMTFTGDWGISYQHERNVTDVLSEAILWTVLLMSVSMTFMFLVGIALGKLAARRRGKATDLTITGFGIFFYGMPVFWFAIVLMVVFVGWFHLLPAKGYMTDGVPLQPITASKIWDILVHMTLPAVALAVGSVAGVVLLMRNSLIDVLTEDYIITAYAKGLNERQVMRKHAGPNARLPIVTTIAMDTAFIFGGVFQIEVVFSYKGIGWYTMEAIWNQDYPVLQFIFFIGGVAVVIANLIADLVLVKLDPRVQIT
ncbi:MAG: ABC transporter permease [Thermoplasmata archaeon]|nr:ABC transporter permease [Thermoplasmata archaeon]